MNKYLRAAWGVGFFGFVGASLCGAAPLAEMGDSAHWSAAISQIGGPVSPPPKPTSDGSRQSRVQTGTHVVKSKQFIRRLTQWNDGTSTERWWVGPYCFIKEPHSQFVFIVQWQSGVPAGPLRDQFTPADFPELAWVDPKYLVETKESEKGPVELYGLPQNSPLVLEKEKAYEQLVEQARKAGQDITLHLPAPLVGSSHKEFAKLAWVDKTSHRPLAYEGEGMRWEYSFPETPADPLVFPDAYKQALVEYLQMANVQEGNEMKMPKIK